MRVLLSLLLCFSAGYCLAQSIHAYKSVHADGTVGYSDTRPATATSVTEVDVYHKGAAIEQEGQQRLQEIDSVNEEIEKKRADEKEAKRKYESRLAETRQELSDAERGLANARESKKSGTADRIALEEERVQLARRRLREITSAGP